MTARTHLPTQTLYDRDYVLWLETTVEQLRSGQLSTLDIENLIEELEGMARSERRALKSLLIRLFEHFIKLAYWESERARNANHWNGEINNFRHEIQDLLADSPSLKPYLDEIFTESYSVALETVRKKMGLKKGTLPSEPIATVEQVLDNNWLPITIDED
jgi:hypothetical protein